MTVMRDSLEDDTVFVATPQKNSLIQAENARLLTEKVDALQAELQQASSVIGELTTRAAEAETRVREDDDRHENMQGTLQDLQTRCEIAEAEVQRLQLEYEKARDDVDSLQATKTLLTKQVGAAVSQMFCCGVQDFFVLSIFIAFVYG